MLLLRSSLVPGIMALAAGLGVPLSGVAQVHVELGDAGELPGTAQIITGLPVLTSITGSLGANDADMFRFHSPGGIFSATVTVLSSAGDSQLFLFNSTGFGVLANDDDGAPFAPSRIFTATLPAGDYFLAISEFNRDPVSAGGLIFPGDSLTDITAVVGPTGPGGGLPVSGWQSDSGSGFDYSIALENASGVSEAVPGVPDESSPLVLLSLGVLSLLWMRRRIVS
jgi:hypothetical protein